MHQFTKRDTNICKGIAILFMILHHTVGLYYNNFDLSWYARNSESIGEMILLFFSTAGKVCVCLLAILSGYGVSKSYTKTGFNKTPKKDMKFILSRYVKLYSIYLPVILILASKRVASAILRHNFSKLVEVAKCTLIDLSMFYRVTFNSWYLTAIIILYFLFPLMYKMIRKLPLVAITISALPWILRFCFNLKIGTFDSFISCMLPFSLGILFEQRNVLQSLKFDKALIGFMLPSIILVATFILRLIFSLPMDIFFALAIILFEINVMSMTKFAAPVLDYLGQHSANMWLIHPIVLTMVTGNAVFVFIAATVLSLLISTVFEFVKEKTGYNILFKKLIKYLY